jgi:hypothetical protein
LSVRKREEWCAVINRDGEKYRSQRSPLLTWNSAVGRQRSERIGSSGQDDGQRKEGGLHCRVDGSKNELSLQRMRRLTCNGYGGVVWNTCTTVSAAFDREAYDDSTSAVTVQMSGHSNLSTPWTLRAGLLQLLFLCLSPPPLQPRKVRTPRVPVMVSTSPENVSQS